MGFLLLCHHSEIPEPKGTGTHRGKASFKGTQVQPHPNPAAECLSRAEIAFPWLFGSRPPQRLLCPLIVPGSHGVAREKWQVEVEEAGS